MLASGTQIENRLFCIEPLFLCNIVYLQHIMLLCQGLTLSFRQSDDIICLSFQGPSGSHSLQLCSDSTQEIRKCKSKSCTLQTVWDKNLYPIRTHPHHMSRGVTTSLSDVSVQAHFSSQSLFDYLRGIQEDDATLTQFGNTLLSIFKDNLRNDRCTHCNALFKTLLLKGFSHVSYLPPVFDRTYSMI